MSRFEPASVHGLYAERAETRPGAIERRLRAWSAHVTRVRRPGRRAIARLEAQVDAQARTFEGCDDAALLAHAASAGVALRRDGLRRATSARAFALVREAARRTLGLRHYDTQLAGGMAMLEGRLAEMETGEGKTLTATLPAATAALAGVPVHVVTVNDYLAKRDAQTLAPLYAALGLRIGVVCEGMSAEERRDAYAADVTYVTNKQVAFDFLRDRLALADRRGDLRLRLESATRPDAAAGRLLLRGLVFAIVDEADSVLIDEARTPLILSAAQEQDEAEAWFRQALAQAAALRDGDHYELRPREWSVRLTARGRARLARAAGQGGGLWGGRRRREELVTQALLVLHLFRRDEHYLVRDGAIAVIDEYTGRVMADRAWGRGVQQLLEVKEGCEMTGVREPLARISYQRFFRRYLHLAGMTGTAIEVAGELRATYGLSCTRIPTHRPLVREQCGQRVFATQREKWEAVAERAAALHAQERPVLVGTRSVAASDRAAQALRARGLSFQVLTARQDQDEAAVVASAGEPGRITVATNMAGRGTDIPLAAGVVGRGGLAVIVTERHDAGRIDRQLAGRCARQGDPGSVELLLSLEDPLVETFAPEALRRRLFERVARRGATGWLEQKAAGALVSLAQRRAEALHRRVRSRVLEADRELAEALAFSGRPE